ncbi:MAG TPA: DUF4097 family beta strand repeat-containing protein [Tahibacter sp.]|nr:DUF4097 family beta strand repeat-containing protein [Tahibacter sp.]
MTRILIAILLAAGASAAFADDCEFSAQRKLDLPAEGLKLLRLQTRAGDLKIAGTASGKTVELRGKACASTAEALEQLQLKHNRDGATLSVETTTPEQQDGFKLFGSNYAYIDLDVYVPESFDIDLTDSSGDIEIGDVGTIELADSSGDIRIRNALGDVRIADSSGDINLDRIGGNVTIVNDSSGDIEIDGVRRNVDVQSDSSGDITLDNVDGNASVGHDSSGDIRFRHIGGNADVGSDSSGGIVADGVKGDFTVRHKSGGKSGISQSNVGGRVSVPDHD